MALASLTFKEIKARPVICKLTRPAVARIGAMTHLPIILIDLFTEEGVVGSSFLKPYLPKAMKYLARRAIAPAIPKAGESENRGAVSRREKMRLLVALVAGPFVKPARGMMQRFP